MESLNAFSTLRTAAAFHAINNAAPAPSRVVCSWCTRLMSEGSLPISHGICPSCIATFEQPAVSDVERTIENAQRQAAA